MQPRIHRAATCSLTVDLSPGRNPSPTPHTHTLWAHSQGASAPGRPDRAARPGSVAAAGAPSCGSAHRRDEVDEVAVGHELGVGGGEVALDLVAVLDLRVHSPHGARSAGGSALNQAAPLSAHPATIARPHPPHPPNPPARWSAGCRGQPSMCPAPSRSAPQRCHPARAAAAAAAATLGRALQEGVHSYRSSRNAAPTALPSPPASQQSSDTDNSARTHKAGSSQPAAG